MIHAACSVESNKCPYIRWYVGEQIAAIPHEDIDISREKGHAAALVIGPTHWVRPIYEFLLTEFANVRLQVSEDVGMTLLDGYRLLARDEKSRLGWRVLLHLDSCQGVDVLLRSMYEGAELAEVIPSDWGERHLPLAASVATLLAGEDLSEDESARLTAALGMSIEQVLGS